MLRLISTRTLRVCSLTAPVVNSRCLSVSANSMTMSRTYEPTVLHNSDENKDALGWAKQIFELREKGIFDEWNKLKDAPAEPLLLVCRTRAYNRLPHYEKEVLSHFGLGRRRKVRSLSQVTVVFLKFHLTFAYNFPTLLHYRLSSGLW